MPRIGLQDVAINASWDKNDGHEIDSEFEFIRRKSIPPLTFQEKLERVFNDQTARFERSGKLYDPLYVSDKQLDLVTFSGMHLLAQIATGKSDKIVTHFACGTGIKAESRADVALGFLLCL